MSLVEKIKNMLGKKGALLTLILAVIGVLLILIPTGSEEARADDMVTLEEYKLKLEDELTDLCHSVKGVGRCRVMVTFLRGEENTYKGSVLIESKPPRVLGVSIVCQGADNDSVRAYLTEMICALFDIGANRVAVLRLEN